MDYLRYKGNKSTMSYILQNSKTQKAVQDSLNTGLHRTKLMPPKIDVAIDESIEEQEPSTKKPRIYKPFGMDHMKQEIDKLNH